MKIQQSLFGHRTRRTSESGLGERWGTIKGASQKPPAQYMEALRAGTRNERSESAFSRLPRTEAGL